MHKKTSRNNELTWWTFAFVVEFRRLLASAPVLAGRRRTGNVVRLAVFPSVSGFTVASVSRDTEKKTKVKIDAIRMR